MNDEVRTKIQFFTDISTSGLSVVAGMNQSDRAQTFLYDFRLRVARHTRL